MLQLQEGWPGFEANCGSLNDVLPCSHMENGFKFMTSLSMTHDSHSMTTCHSIQQLHITLFTHSINNEGTCWHCRLDTKMHERKIERSLAAADTNPRPDSIK